MRETISGIWTNAPVWVWPLLVLLVALGLLSMRTRTISIVPFYFLPFIGFLSFRPIAGLAHQPANWITFLAAFALGAALFFGLQKRLKLDKTARRVTLKGEALTLITLMVIFWSNFASGVFDAVAPQAKQAILFSIVFSALIGLCAGSFLGRSFRVLLTPAQ